MENSGKRPFFRPDWGNTTWADMAGLGSIGLNNLVILPSFAISKTLKKI